jgi:hypothetical protein
MNNEDYEKNPNLDIGKACNINVLNHLSGH